jgi:hypothetical protein
MPSADQVQQQIRFIQRQVDLNQTQMVQKFSGNRQKRDALEQFMKREVEAMRGTLGEMQLAVDSLAPGSHDEDIALLHAATLTLQERADALQDEGVQALSILAEATDKRLDAIDKLLDRHNAPRGMEKRLSEMDLRMDRFQGALARLEKRSG